MVATDNPNNNNIAANSKSYRYTEINGRQYVLLDFNNKRTGGTPTNWMTQKHLTNREFGTAPIIFTIKRDEKTGASKSYPLWKTANDEYHVHPEPTEIPSEEPIYQLPNKNPIPEHLVTLQTGSYNYMIVLQNGKLQLRINTEFGYCPKNKAPTKNDINKHCLMDRNFQIKTDRDKPLILELNSLASELGNTFVKLSNAQKMSKNLDSKSCSDMSVLLLEKKKEELDRKCKALRAKIAEPIPSVEFPSSTGKMLAYNGIIVYLSDASGGYGAIPKADQETDLETETKKLYQAHRNALQDVGLPIDVFYPYNYPHKVLDRDHYAEKFLKSLPHQKFEVDAVKNALKDLMQKFENPTLTIEQADGLILNAKFELMSKYKDNFQLDDSSIIDEHYFTLDDGRIIDRRNIDIVPFSDSNSIKLDPNNNSFNFQPDDKALNDPCKHQRRNAFVDDGTTNILSEVNETYSSRKLSRTEEALKKLSGLFDNGIISYDEMANTFLSSPVSPRKPSSRTNSPTKDIEKPSPRNSLTKQVLDIEGFFSPISQATPLKKSPSNSPTPSMDIENIAPMVTQSIEPMDIENKVSEAEGNIMHKNFPIPKAYDPSFSPTLGASSRFSKLSLSSSDYQLSSDNQSSSIDSNEQFSPSFFGTSQSQHRRKFSKFRMSKSANNVGDQAPSATHTKRVRRPSDEEERDRQKQLQDAREIRSSFVSICLMGNPNKISRVDKDNTDPNNNNNNRNKNNS